MKVLLLLVVLSLLLIRANAISFSLEPEAQKCLREEVHKNVLVVGDYEIEMIYGQRTDVEVVDSKGHTLFRKEDASDGKFAFTTEDYEIFDVCFKSYTNHGQTGNQPSKTVVLNLKHGVEAKDYQDIGKVEKLKPMELELKRLEDLTEAIVNDFSYMRAREEEMRDTNESTNTRVLYFSIFSMCCLLFLAGWQVFYLKRFFKAKKLIE